MDLQPPGSHFIDGSFVVGSGACHYSIYPANGERIAEICWAGDLEIDNAVKSAKKGFEIWKNTPPSRRAEVLGKTARLLRADNRRLAEIETFDTGKPLQETLVADAASGADCLEYFGAQSATMTGEHITLSGEAGDFAYTKRVPLGVCVGIGAWNYPIQIACWKAAPALACGNSMIFKPSELTPLSALQLAEAFKKAGLPDGVFNVLQGDAKLGTALVAHRDVAKISVTGSLATGIKIASNAARSLKQVTLELGGKSPLIICDDANLDEAVAAAMVANFYSSGQICSNGTRVFVHKKIKRQFIDKIIKKTAKLKIGDPMNENTQIGPMIAKSHYQKVMSYLEQGKREAELLIGGKRVQVKGFEKGYWLQPTIFDVDDDNAKIATEEIFGPLLSILSFSDEDEVIHRANATDYGLAAGVFTSNLARAHRMVEKLQAGVCWINSYNLTPVQLPFGGVKMSGIGRENGKAALQHYSQSKSVYVGINSFLSPY